MVKVKNKRNAGLADKVHNKKRAEENKNKLNPFEVHINREKIKVLGQKSKHDRGLPGVSRAKAQQKRKETLGVEMKLMNKTSAFIDRRIGERDKQLSAEERMVARFAAERAKQHRKDIYNLADDEILTHRGQTLEQIEKFDDPRSEDEDEDEGKRFGGLADDFVSEGHFGGGVLSKSDSKDGAKSHKDLIEQLIADSKKRKAEKQKEKEQTLDLTEKLDSEWKDLQPVVFKRARVEEEKESVIDKLLSQAEKKNEDYDKTMRELRFEKRGTPSDGLKTDEKQKKEERQRIEQMERERAERMVGEGVPRVAQSNYKHRSADDLDDNFDLQDEKEFMLAYDSVGKPLVPDNVLKDYSVPNAKPKFDDGISDTSDDETDDNDEVGDDSNDGNDTSDHLQDADQNEIANKDSSTEDKTSKAHKVEKNKSIDNDSSFIKDTKDSSNKLVTLEPNKNDLGESSDDEGINDNKANELEKKSKSNKLKETTLNKSGYEESSDDEEESEDEDSEVKSNGKVDKQTKEIIESDSDEESSEGEASDDDDKLDNLDDLKQSDEESSNEEDNSEVKEKIGSFFELKSTVGDKLKELLAGKTPAQQSVALEKLIKSYDPSLAENNKDLLSQLFAHMLQYVNEIFTNLKQSTDIVKAFQTFDRIAPYFYDLARTNKVSSKKYIAELLKEKHDIYKMKPRKVPDLETLIFFKLISLLYPTSDFRHPIATPSLIFMTEILSSARFQDAYSVSRGIFITSLVLEYTVLSKRFVPAAINFLRGLLFLGANTSILNQIQVVPPFRFHRDVKILNLEDDCSKLSVDSKMAANDFVLEEIDNDFKIRSILVCTRMVKEFFSNYNDLDVQEALFSPHLKLYNRIDLELYPSKVANEIKETVRLIKETLEMKTYAPLCREKKKPKALRLYEPDVQEVFTGCKSGKLSRAQADRDRLKHKHKREMKGALREIRRDKAYVASVKIRQKIYSDNVRKEKVRQIYKDAAIQQGELNQLKRHK